MLNSATLEIPNATVNVVRGDNRHRRFEGLYANNMNLCVFYSTENSAEGRYIRPSQGTFRKIGQLVFRPAGFQVQARGVSNDRCIECWLDESRMASFNQIVPRWTEERLEKTLDIRASQLSSYLLRLRQEVMRPSLAAQAVVDALFVILLHDLAVYLADDPTLVHWDKGGGHSSAVKLVVERIRDVTDVTPTVGELAEMTALSERHLLRVFREAKGVSLVEFIRQARLEHARQLLDSTDLPLKEVAYRLGFSSHASFTTAFGREMNVQPSEYRRVRRRNIFLSGRR